jgi:hypothetical protein
MAERSLRDRSKRRLTESGLAYQKAKERTYETQAKLKEMNGMSHLDKQLKQLAKQGNRALIHYNLLNYAVPIFNPDTDKQRVAERGIADVESLKRLSKHATSLERVGHRKSESEVMQKWFQTILLNLERQPIPPELARYNTTEPPHWAFRSPKHKKRAVSNAMAEVKAVEGERIQTLNEYVVEKLDMGLDVDPQEIRDLVYVADPAAIVNAKMNTYARRFNLQHKDINPIMNKFMTELNEAGNKKRIEEVFNFTKRGSIVGQQKFSLNELVRLAEIRREMVENPSLRKQYEQAPRVEVNKEFINVQDVAHDVATIQEMTAEDLGVPTPPTASSRLARKKGPEHLEHVSGDLVIPKENLDQYEDDFVVDDDGSEQPSDWADKLDEVMEEDIQAEERTGNRRLRKVSDVGGKSFEELEREAALQDEMNVENVVPGMLDVEAEEGEESESEQEEEEDAPGFFMTAEQAQDVVSEAEQEVEQIVAPISRLARRLGPSRLAHYKDYETRYSMTHTKEIGSHCKECAHLISLIPLWRYAYHLKTKDLPEKPDRLLPRDPKHAFLDGVCSGCYTWRKGYSYQSHAGKTVSVPGYAVPKGKSAKVPRNYESYLAAYHIYKDKIKG